MKSTKLSEDKIATNEAKRIIDLTPEEAKEYLLKDYAYFRDDLPSYFGFQKLLLELSKRLEQQDYQSIQQENNPAHYSDVNYVILANKDGRWAWRPMEMMHPVIYIYLARLISDHWATISDTLRKYVKNSVVESHGIPVVPRDGEKFSGAQIKNWWSNVEQKSLRYSLDYDHYLQTDIQNCYGSLYTHSIAWALHGKEEVKKRLTKKKTKAKKVDSDLLLGDEIDKLIRAGRYGQTNGIPQGPVLMDLIAELVLGSVDDAISEKLRPLYDEGRFRVIRYRDDYRIFADSEEVLKRVYQEIEKHLRHYGFRLNPEKTFDTRNVIEAAIKADKWEGLYWGDVHEAWERLDRGNSDYLSPNFLQNVLLRLHDMTRRYPNSGFVRKQLFKLGSAMWDHRKVLLETAKRNRMEDSLVLIAIVTDIAFLSPSALPLVASILSILLALVRGEEREEVWEKVTRKLSKIPHGGYWDVWLQRVAVPLRLKFHSEEPLCALVEGKGARLWESDWLTDESLRDLLEESLPKFIVDNEEIERLRNALDDQDPQGIVDPDLVAIEPEEVGVFAVEKWTSG